MFIVRKIIIIIFKDHWLQDFHHNEFAPWPYHDHYYSWYNFWPHYAHFEERHDHFDGQCHSICDHGVYGHWAGHWSCETSACLRTGTKCMQI